MKTKREHKLSTFSYFIMDQSLIGTLSTGTGYLSRLRQQSEIHCQFSSECSEIRYQTTDQKENPDRGIPG